MSRPGDPGREQRFLDGNPTDVMAQIVNLIAQHGARSFELAYDRAPESGPPLQPDEEPAPGDAVVWTASAVFRVKTGRRRQDVTRTGTHTVPAGGSQHAGGLYAAVALLEALGANVVLVDKGAPDPREAPDQDGPVA